jgi:hypothetical protein
MGQIPGRFGQCFLDGRGIALIRRLQRHRDHRTALHIHRVLGLMCQMRGSVLHLRDPRIQHSIPTSQHSLDLIVVTLRQ